MEDKKFNNLSCLVDNLYSPFGPMGAGAPVSGSDPLFYNLRWYIISNDRQLISEMYVEHGLVQVLVDQPVDDAFRGGFDIKSSQLSANDVEKIQLYFEKHKVIYAITQAMKWTRLYGGGGVLLIVPEKPDTPFDIKRLKPDTPIAFEAVDMWEMYQDKINIQGDMSALDPEDEFYHYYGKRVHKSRIYISKGKEAPSFVKPRLRGWGMSELERIVRSINQFLKNQNVVYELMDEAKVDVYRLEALNSTLATSQGTQQVAHRIQMANMIKNYNHALMMDKEDEYEQKQVNFSGLDMMLVQFRTQVAADLKMPVTKLFGMSSAGFNSGEDDIENYNSMIEGEVRAKAKHICMSMTNIACQQLFGFIPDDLQIEFPPLRIMSAEQEEKIKDSQHKRILDSYAAGLISAEDAKRMLNADNLLGTEIDETDETFNIEEEPEDGTETGSIKYDS